MKTGGPVTLEPAVAAGTTARVCHGDGGSAVRTARILVASDNALVRTGLEAVLRGELDLQVAAEVRSAAAAVSAIQRLRPDLLLLDIAMGGGSFADTLRRLHDEPALRIMLLATRIEVGGVFHALQLGARGVLFEDAPPALIVKGIRAVLRGEYWVSREVIGDLARRLSTARGGAGAAARTAVSNGHHLTRRERDIVYGVVEGCSNRDIAARLRVHEQTVTRHLSAIYRKLGVADRDELARFAVNRRLADR